jgi:hypothetical protein
MDGQMRLPTYRLRNVYRASFETDQLAVVGIGLEPSLVSAMELQLGDDLIRQLASWSA